MINLKVIQELASTGTIFQTKERAKTDCSYCRSPCCQLLVELLPDEKDKYVHETAPIGKGGELKFILARREDGYCVYYVHGLGCSTYEDKPKVCDYYSCRNDDRMTPSLRYGSIKPL